MTQKGFVHLLLLPVILVLLVIVGGLIFSKSKNSPNIQNSLDSLTAKNKGSETGRVIWQFDYDQKVWKSSGNPPNCSEPIEFPSPADVNLVSGILYPGQIRGGEYKPHGGFRFDSLDSNHVNVYAPIDGHIIKAAHHPSLDEVQYVIYFVNDCGIMYKLDHLLEVTDKFEQVFESIPLGGENDTRTTTVSPPVFVSKGELVATKVGLRNNVFFDFGVYDLRGKNGVDYSGRNIFNVEEYAEHALCWLDHLEETDKTVVKALPGADGQTGKTSDYCE